MRYIQLLLIPIFAVCLYKDVEDKATLWAVFDTVVVLLNLISVVTMISDED